MTETYLRWFRETGQFLQPADAFNNDQEKLEMLKQWGSFAHEAHEEEMRELRHATDGEIEDSEKLADEADKRGKRLKSAVLEALDSAVPSSEKKAQIRKLCA